MTNAAVNTIENTTGETHAEFVSKHDVTPIAIEAMTYEELCELYLDQDTTQEQRKLINKRSLWQEVDYFHAGDLFGKFWKGNPQEVLAKRKYRHPDCRKGPAIYYPDERALMDTVLYLVGDRHLSLGLYGDTGTGKSEMPRYVCDVLNIPLLQVSLTPSSKEDKLMGTMMVKDGMTFFEEGVLPRAYDAESVGYCLVIDEIDKGAENVVAKCHDVADYKPFTVDDTGTTYFPHDSFRLICTGQTAGNGDARGIYNVDKLDRAFCARFMWTRVPYPSMEVIKLILKDAFPRLTDGLVNKLGLFYDMCIKALENVRLEEEGKAMVRVLDGSDTTQRLNTPASIRLMKGWANELVKFGQYRTIRDGYQRTIGHSAEEDDVRALELMLESAFGDVLEKSPVLLPAKKVVQPKVVAAQAKPEPIAQTETTVKPEATAQQEQPEAELVAAEPKAKSQQEQSTEEEKPNYPESPIQDITNVKLGLYVYVEGDERKFWAIGADRRGTHTIYRNPETGAISYYHVEMAKFPGEDNVRDYVTTKIGEKLEKGYLAKGLITCNLETGQLYEVTPNQNS
ncbi:AAA family ATPase [Vibrio alginolyticus]|uniref:AAA family ATPase n=1 Tax=Vibrio alginolyticus TaxID=663 RepID=UPI0022AA08C0|nr:AAA family ATPase [Vibrio alginolyticus]MCZ2803350.1 AAA family ATPase [Vibrio alginolyticus]